MNFLNSTTKGLKLFKELRCRQYDPQLFLNEKTCKYLINNYFAFQPRAKEMHLVQACLHLQMVNMKKNAMICILFQFDVFIFDKFAKYNNPLYFILHLDCLIKIPSFLRILSYITLNRYQIHATNFLGDNIWLKQNLFLAKL